MPKELSLDELDGGKLTERGLARRAA